MMRKCHLNTCPVGIATQDPELRKRFTGEVDHLVNFFKFLAQELREIMASLGFRTVNEMVGRVDMLHTRSIPDLWKCTNLDLSAMLYQQESLPHTTLHQSLPQDHGLTDVLDWKLLEVAMPALEKKEKVKAVFQITNTDRTTCTLLSHEIAKRYKAAGLPKDTIHFKFQGTAGQSFGAFATSGLTLELEGDANDYFGKGLSGAKLITYPAWDGGFIAEESIIIGNVAFYGATSGEAFIHGMAGERFAVRNSGAHLVIEGVGDHGCEYMTGGAVIILGPISRNFGAGMSGGQAYLYDVHREARKYCNMEMIDLDPPSGEDMEYIRMMMDQHFRYTNSQVAKCILQDFEVQIKHFVKVNPKGYKKPDEVKRQKIGVNLYTPFE
jgi:glutamate synthase (NADPH/NADH) large chain